MIHTSKQLKDKVRNLSNGDNDIAKALIRTFMMERFLERVSLSKYRDNYSLFSSRREFVIQSATSSSDEKPAFSACPCICF